MDVKEAIESRRSIRKWKDKEVTKEIVAELLDAARLAPSAKNVQSHRYYILEKNDIAELEKDGIFNQAYVYKAPLVIVCCAPIASDIDEDPNNYAHIDISIATAFLTLRATELDLGSVFVAWINREALKKKFNIPESYIIPFVIPIGYPDEKPAKKDKLYLNEIVLN